MSEPGAGNGLGSEVESPRVRMPLDRPWKFHLGHATDTDKDFGHGTSYFTYLAKTGYGDGPAAKGFDDRAWREVRIPHDWAVEVPFDPKASHSHGYRALGPGFPQNSVGWYRHHFEIPESDLGRRISLEFDGIQRAARVFVNGFFVGEQKQGNLSQSYDVTPYLDYGGENVIAVRADVSIEQGWYYEGAGINRHVYLLKADPIHVAHHGTFVRTEIQGGRAAILVDTTVLDERENSATSLEPELNLKRQQLVLDASGKVVAKTKPVGLRTAAGIRQTVHDSLMLARPELWSVDEPNLYTLVTRLENSEGELLDEYETPFGVRSIRFDPNQGFFLNGKRLELKGSNNHEDHAGVGTATPDSLIEYRLRLLKGMGMNAYRASHAPAAPALLDIADRIGMLVIDENRLMGVNAYHMDAVRNMIERDRNHPSIILWSLGNEEWAIEGNAKGARIVKAMQSRAKQMDATRPLVVAISGGWGGISTEVEAMGVNYFHHGDTDEQHRKHPWQILVGTEETTTQQTRGVYYEDKARAQLPPQTEGSSGGNAEAGWKHYAARPYLAGVFYWTGFDYRGEPTPYGYPAISSQFGILDTCGFPKDSYYYLKSWWSDEPLLHIARHWNWPGREGEDMDVTVYGNVQEVELFQDERSLGKKSMPPNGHLSFRVSYKPGQLRAQGYVGGQPTLTDTVSTTGPAAAIAIKPHVDRLRAGSSEVAVLNISVLDEQGRVVPTAENSLHFSITGPGKIIGVGNGSPSSHEADVRLEALRTEELGVFRAPNAADSESSVIFETRFGLPKLVERESIQSLLLSALGEKQTATLNGIQLYRDASPAQARLEVAFSELGLKQRGNVLRIEASPFKSREARYKLKNLKPAVLSIRQAPEDYTRKAFNGWAQAIVQAGDETGTLTFSAAGDGLKSASARLQVY